MLDLTETNNADCICISTPKYLRLPVVPINIRLGFATVLTTVHVQRLIHKTRNTSTVQVQIAYTQNEE
jgi:hypothetical protein